MVVLCPFAHTHTCGRPDTVERGGGTGLKCLNIFLCTFFVGVTKIGQKISNLKSRGVEILGDIFVYIFSASNRFSCRPSHFHPGQWLSLVKLLGCRGGGNKSLHIIRRNTGYNN